MEDDHVSWLYPARSDAPEGRGKLKRATVSRRDIASMPEVGHVNRVLRMHATPLCASQFRVDAEIRTTVQSPGAPPNPDSTLRNGRHLSQVATIRAMSQHTLDALMVTAIAVGVTSTILGIAFTLGWLFHRDWGTPPTSANSKPPTPAFDAF
jgi:hypothetical protein